MKNYLKVAVFALVLGGAVTASAVPHTYTVGGDSSVVSNTGDGLIISTALSANLAGTSFTLDDGQSFTLNFFRIWTDEAGVDSDDRNPKSIVANLDFSNPDSGAAVSGLSYGVTIFNGFGQYGEVTWGNTAPTFTLEDRVFRVALNGAQFNRAIGGGLASGGEYGANITATVTQLSSSVVQPPAPAPVPDHGGTAMLLGLALGGFFLFRRQLAA